VSNNQTQKINEIKNIKNGRGRYMGFIKKEKHLKEKLLEYQRVYKSVQTSWESYKKFHTNLLKRRQEQVSYVVRSLNFIDQSLKNPESFFPEGGEIEMVESYLKTAHSLSHGMITSLKKEPISLSNVLEEIQLLFAEKIYKFNITLKISCPENLFFYGDSLFTKLALINLLGKPIYRVPKNGKILVIAKEEAGNIKIEIQDNGYALNKIRENLIKKSFNLFINDTIFQQMCRENGFIYESSKSSQGLTVTKIIIPDVQTENLKSNVIQLFK
jgi:hypothetical protein